MPRFFLKNVLIHACLYAGILLLTLLQTKEGWSCFKVLLLFDFPAIYGAILFAMDVP